MSPCLAFVLSCRQRAVTLPLAVVALLFALKLIPAHVNETSDAVDNPDGILSVALVGSSDVTTVTMPRPG